VHRYESGERVYKVIDFGLAAMKAASDETRLTDPALFVGTLAYAAPEQIRGDAVTPATDIYSLAVIAYEMLTGTRPFDAATRRRSSPGRWRDTGASSQAAGGLPQRSTMVLKALKECERSWPSVTAFADALHGARTSVGTAPASGPAACCRDTSWARCRPRPSQEPLSRGSHALAFRSRFAY
jgi:serine/threonine protein kinase